MYTVCCLDTCSTKEFPTSRGAIGEFLRVNRNHMTMTAIFCCRREDAVAVCKFFVDNFATGVWYQKSMQDMGYDWNYINYLYTECIKKVEDGQRYFSVIKEYPDQVYPFCYG